MIRLSMRFVLLWGLIGVAHGAGCGRPAPAEKSPPPTALERQMASAPASSPDDLQALSDRLMRQIASLQEELDAGGTPAEGAANSASTEDEAARGAALERRMEKLENEWAGIQRLSARLEADKREGIGRPDVAGCAEAMDQLRAAWRDRHREIVGHE